MSDAKPMWAPDQQRIATAKVICSSDFGVEVNAILGPAPAQLGRRYWADGHRSVWILEEIGKEELISASFVIHHVRVLAYRESRGQEARSRIS